MLEQPLPRHLPRHLVRVHDLLAPRRCARARSRRRRAAPGRGPAFASPSIQALLSPQAISVAFLGVVEVVLLLAHLEALAARRGRVSRGSTVFWNSMFMNMNIGLVLITSARAGLVSRGVEMLVDAVVVDDRHVARLPVVADVVVDLVALAVEDVEGGLVDVAVLLALAAGPVFLEVEVEVLGDAVLGLDVVAAVGLRPVDELDLAAPCAPAAWRAAAPASASGCIRPGSRARRCGPSGCDNSPAAARPCRGASALSLSSRRFGHRVAPPVHAAVLAQNRNAEQHSSMQNTRHDFFRPRYNRKSAKHCNNLFVAISALPAPTELPLAKIIAFLACGTLFRYYRAKRRKDEDHMAGNGKHIELCAKDDVTEGEPLRVETDDLELAVFRVEGDFYVTDDACTHGPGSLSEGFQEGHVIECDFHDGAVRHPRRRGRRPALHGGVEHLYGRAARHCRGDRSTRRLTDPGGMEWRRHHGGPPPFSCRSVLAVRSTCDDRQKESEERRHDQDDTRPAGPS